MKEILTAASLLLALPLLACNASFEESPEDSTIAALNTPRVGADMQVTSAHGGGCWDLPIGVAGTPGLQQSVCHGGTNQLWRFEVLSASSPDVFRIRSVHSSNLCVQLPSPVASGTGIALIPCGSGQDQQWVVSPEANGVFARIHSRLNLTLCLDVRGAVSEGQAAIQVFTCHGGANQAWRFRRLLGTTTGDGCSTTIRYGASGPTSDPWWVASFHTTSDDVDATCATWPFARSEVDCPTQTNWMVVNRYAAGTGDYPVACFRQ